MLPHEEGGADAVAEELVQRCLDVREVRHQQGLAFPLVPHVGLRQGGGPPEVRCECARQKRFMIFIIDLHQKKS